MRVVSSISDHCPVCCQDNGVWDFAQDEQIMMWATQRPEDWQLGGKCDAYMWGGGRHGQMCESGRSALVPTLTSSFSSAQQVRPADTHQVTTFDKHSYFYTVVLSWLTVLSDVKLCSIFPHSTQQTSCYK